MKPILITSFLFLFAFSFATAQDRSSPEAEAFFNKAMSQINVKHVRWIKNTAKESHEKIWSVSDITNKVKSYRVSYKSMGKDIEALTILVLIQAAKSAQEDLKAIMAGIKSINEQKKVLSDAIAMLNKNNPWITRKQYDSLALLLKNQSGNKSVSNVAKKDPVSKLEIDELKEKLIDKKDSISEMGQQDMLLMQMAMEKMHQLEKMISDLMKKFGDAATEAIQALKSS